MLNQFITKGRGIALALVCSLLPMTAFANANDMISGGCTTRTDCAQKIAADNQLQNFYANYGVRTAGIKSTKTTFSGEVSSNGEVRINGRVVATNATSFGRQNIAGSSQVGPFFKRPTSVSFASSPLHAWVHFRDGAFAYAIITSCGNLVTAKAVVSQKPASSKPVAAQPVVAQPAAPVATTVNVVQVQSQTQAQTQTVPAQPAATPTPAPQPAPTPALAPAVAPVTTPAPLPATGSAAFGLVGFSSIITAGWYYLRSRRDLRTALRLPSL